MTAGSVSAAVLNAQRSKRTDKVWGWIDLHPMHAAKQKASGRQVFVAAVAMAGDEWQLATGITMEKLLAGDIDVSTIN